MDSISRLLRIYCDNIRHVWKCGCGCFSKNFRVEMHQNDVFSFFKNHF